MCIRPRSGYRADTEPDTVNQVYLKYILSLPPETRFGRKSLPTLKRGEVSKKSIRGRARTAFKQACSLLPAPPRRSAARAGCPRGSRLLLAHPTAAGRESHALDALGAAAAAATCMLDARAGCCSHPPACGHDRHGAIITARGRPGMRPSDTLSDGACASNPPHPPCPRPRPLAHVLTECSVFVFSQMVQGREGGKQPPPQQQQRRGRRRRRPGRPRQPAPRTVPRIVPRIVPRDRASDRAYAYSYACARACACKLPPPEPPPPPEMPSPDPPRRHPTRRHTETRE